MLVIGTLKITALVEYEHPDWETAAYDSEDRILLPFDDISGETEVEFSAPFSMTIKCDEFGNPQNIEELRFQDVFWNIVDITPPPESYN